MPAHAAPQQNASALESTRNFPEWMLQQLGTRTPSSPSEFLRQLRAMHQQVLGTAHQLPGLDDPDDPCPQPSGEASGSEEEEEEEEEDCADEVDDDEAWDAAEAAQARRRDRLSLPPPGPSSFGPPEPCSWLSPGQSFLGKQRQASASGRRSDDWEVEVKIEAYDPARGYVCGVMEAQNVPGARCPVVTFWEGEIVDSVNHSFLTRKWGADRATDLSHWSKFEGYTPLRRGAGVSGTGGAADAQAPGQAECPFIFMRWKEQFFVSSADFGLTIAGFYYVCLSRKDGQLQGFYYDDHSSPFQELLVSPKQQGGMCFSSYELR